jgi:transposase
MRPQDLIAENQRLRGALETQAADLEDQKQAWEQERAALLERYRQLSEKQRALEHTLALFRRALFGSRSERVDAKELEDRIAKAAAEAKTEVAQEKAPGDPPAEADEEQPEAPATPTPPTDNKPTDEPEKPNKRKARPHGRGPVPQHLKRRRVEHPVPEAQTFCALCPDHPRMVCIGEDTCEKLVKIPAQYEVEVHAFAQWACQKCHAGVVCAPAQDNRLKADASVVADVVVKKYAEHQPLYRQQQGFARLDIPMTRQTLCDWTGWCSDQVEPVVKAMADFIRRQKAIQSDETSVRMQLPKGQMHTARLWAYGLPWAEVVFDFRTDKSQTGPKEFLQGSTAQFIQADGGSSYGPVLDHLSLGHIACMAHIRRKFFEARGDAPLAVDLILAAIQKLYRIERAAKEQALSLEARRERRQREAKPIFEHLGDLINALEKQPEALPKSPLGGALRYAKNQWPAMARYLEVAEAEIDNNSIEHALRSVVLGRRNWLHVGQESGGRRAAHLFSLVVTCKRLGVEPYAYLHDILKRLPEHPNKDIWQLTPRGWQETFGPKAAAPIPA